MDDPGGTGGRLIRLEKAALDLADVVEDLVRDMETISMNLPERTKRTHELGQVKRARELARAVRGAVASARRQAPGSLSDSPPPPSS
ncbi:MAG TPA: hypothetical protein VIO86_07085 [Candidatus Dormibacteraeota bacterium]|jgi:hypothetical protein